MLLVFYLCFQILNKLFLCHFLQLRLLRKRYLWYVIEVYTPHFSLYLLFERKLL